MKMLSGARNMVAIVECGLDSTDNPTNKPEFIRRKCHLTPSNQIKVNKKNK
jgi:hypothetical protein